MKRILIIHPEGNINNNPNLTGIVEILCEKGYVVDIFSKKREAIYQYSPCRNAYLHLEDINNFFQRLELLFFKLLANYKLIIGIDNRGIIEAAKIATIKNIPYGLISYEIFFAEEVGIENKIEEIEACKNISFAIVQDEIRGEQLSIENRIPKSKLIYIPVAGRGIKKRHKRYYLHDNLNIDRSKKIALMMGSLEKWAMVEELINSVKNWPEDWILVLHDRYGFKNQFEYLNKLLNNKKIYLSKEPIKKFDNINRIINSADIGIALYEPIYDSIYSGNNIKYIGLSSGKISTYLQHGLPIIINNYSPMNYYVKKFSLGYVINDINDIILEISKNINNFELNCYEFFNHYLDLNKTISPFLQNISCYKNYHIKKLNNRCIIIIKIISEYIKYELKRKISLISKSIKRNTLNNLIDIIK